MKSDSDVINAVRCLIESPDGRYLFVRRSANDMSQPGAWEIPGGKVEPGQLPDEALKREVVEEVGISLESLEHIEGDVEYEIATGKYAGRHYKSSFYRAMAGDTRVVLSMEHDEYHWWTLKAALDVADLRTDIRDVLRSLMRS